MKSWWKAQQKHNKRKIKTNNIVSNGRPKFRCKKKIVATFAQPENEQNQNKKKHTEFTINSSQPYTIRNCSNNKYCRYIQYVCYFMLLTRIITDRFFLVFFFNSCKTLPNEWASNSTILLGSLYFLVGIRLFVRRKLKCKTIQCQTLINNKMRWIKKSNSCNEIRVMVEFYKLFCCRQLFSSFGWI